jgi:hypothetical protein
MRISLFAGPACRHSSQKNGRHRLSRFFPPVSSPTPGIGIPIARQLPEIASPKSIRRFFMSHKRIVLLLSLFLVLFVAGSAVAATLSGSVTTSKKESQMALPKDVPLAGAQVIIGKDLDLDVGGSGADTIRGKVAAKAVTDDRGKFTANLPGGKYTVIVWKSRYTPATYTVTVPKTNFRGHISIQNERILHTSLSFK